MTTVLLFIRAPLTDENDKKSKIGLDVHTDQDDEQSDTLKVYIAPFEHGDPEDILIFVKDFWRLMRFKRLSDSGPALFQHARLLLSGEARAIFEQLVLEQVVEGDDVDQLMTLEAFQVSLDGLLTHFLPPKAAMQIKHILPLEMSVAAFVYDVVTKKKCSKTF
jgi:hypothetical protein